MRHLAPLPYGRPLVKVLTPSSGCNRTGEIMRGRRRFIVSSVLAVGALTLSGGATALAGSAPSGKGSLESVSDDSVDRARWADSLGISGELLDFDSGTTVRTDDSIFPSDLRVGEQRVVADYLRTTTYRALTSTCSVSVTMGKPFLWNSNAYVRSNFTISVSSGCSGFLDADVRLFRKNVLNAWVQHDFATHIFYPGTSWISNVRTKCRNNSLNVTWMSVGVWAGGPINSPQATLACRM